MEFAKLILSFPRISLNYKIVVAENGRSRTVNGLLDAIEFIAVLSDQGASRLTPGRLGPGECDPRWVFCLLDLPLSLAALFPPGLELTMFDPFSLDTSNWRLRVCNTHCRRVSHLWFDRSLLRSSMLG